MPVAPAGASTLALPMLALLALLVLDVSVGAQFPVPWGGLLTLRGEASFCLDFVPPPGSCGRHLAAP